MPSEAVAEENEKKESEKRTPDPKYPGSPQELEKNPNWNETTHPGQREAGHRELKNEKTGERVRFDKGNPNRRGHAAKDHYHRYNPKTTGNRDKYLDRDGNPTHKNSDRSHLYPQENLEY